MSFIFGKYFEMTLSLLSFTPKNSNGGIGSMLNIFSLNQYSDLLGSAFAAPAYYVDLERSQSNANCPQN